MLGDLRFLGEFCASPKFRRFRPRSRDFGRAIVMGIAFHAGLASLGGNRPHFWHRSCRGIAPTRRAAVNADRHLYGGALTLVGEFPSKLGNVVSGAD
jgi:hypothetical protein